MLKFSWCLVLLVLVTSEELKTLGGSKAVDVPLVEFIQNHFQSAYSNVVADDDDATTTTPLEVDLSSPTEDYVTISGEAGESLIKLIQYFQSTYNNTKNEEANLIEATTSQINHSQLTQAITSEETITSPTLFLKPPASDVETFNDTQSQPQAPLINSKPNFLFPPPIQEELVGPQEPDRGFVEWLLGAVGINQEQRPTDQVMVTAPGTCPPCSCGLTYKHNRIVGGQETQVNEYVWMVVLKYGDRFYCGASVINNKYLLTAAHCVNGFNRNKLTAVFLDHDRSDAFETKIFTRKISQVIKHRGYNTGGSYNNDIAILKVDQELPMTGILKPVCLPPIGKSFTGETGVVVGWGATEQHGQVATKLQEVKVPIMSNIDCRKTGYSSKITDNMLCAGYPEGMKDSCQGDSGGPLHVVNSSVHYIAGIVSWGEGCAQANYPGVYTRVNRYISWIKSNTQDACYCN